MTTTYSFHQPSHPTLTGAPTNIGISRVRYRQPSPTTIPFVTRGYGQSHYLFHLPIDLSDDDEEVILKLHEFLVVHVWRHPAIPSQSWAYKNFCKVSVGRGELSSLCRLDPEAQTQQVLVVAQSPSAELDGAFRHPSLLRGRGQLLEDNIALRPTTTSSQLADLRTSDSEANNRASRVSIKDRVSSEELTRAFYHPSILQGTTPFTEIYQGPVSTMQSTTHLCNAIPISPTVNKEGVATLLIITLAFCIVVSIVIGIESKRFEAGAACGGGLLTLVAAVEALLFWALK